MPAPIVIFIYKRADHLVRNLASLKRCRGFAHTRVIVYGDGPRLETDRAAVEAARKAATDHLGTTAEYHFRDQNIGLAASIIAGVTEVTQRYGRAVVLEDDLELSEHFLTYMNAALDDYVDERRVYQVSGQLFHTPQLEGRTRGLFLPFTSSWGWGTWSRAWNQFDPTAAGWQQLCTDPRLRERFNLGGAYDFSTMLERQMAGHGDSWAIRWYWSVFRNEGVVCFPPVSLVKNTGMDGSGTHGRGVLRRFKKQGPFPPRIDHIDLPLETLVNPVEFEWVRKAMWRQNGGWVGNAADVIRRTLFRATGRHM